MKDFNIDDYKPEELQHVDGRKVVGVWKLKIPTFSTHYIQLEDSSIHFLSKINDNIIPIPKQRWQPLFIGDDCACFFNEDVFDSIDSIIKPTDATHAINLDTLEVVNL